MGCEKPRLFTPPLRKLTRQTSLGFQAIDFARDVCLIELVPWQKWLLIHMLELAPGLTVATMGKRDPREPLFRFRRVVILVGRQNGKTTLLKVLALFFMFTLGARLVLGTAQDLDKAEETWQEAVDLCDEVDEDEQPVRPELFELVADGDIVKVNGKKALVFATGERYKAKAANRKAGRGSSSDLVLLDELREHQTWEAYAAITKTTNARPAAMIAGLSNAGDSTSVVLRHLRLMAHAALGDPDGINAREAELNANYMGAVELDDEDEELDLDELLDDDEEWDSLGIFEWSAPAGCSVFDRDGWAQSNPSLGHVGPTITERTLLADAKSDPEWLFRTEVLCQWPEGSLHGPFPPGSWDAGSDPESKRAPGAEVVACVDVDHDRTRAYVSIAAKREDGRTHTEVVATRAGTEWVLPWFLDDGYPHRAGWRITGQTNGAPVSSLMPALKEAGLDVHDWAGPDLGRAWGQFFDLVSIEDDDGNTRDPGLFHRPQSALDVAAGQAVTRPVGDGSMPDRRRSPVPIGGFVACVGAVWLLGQAPEPNPEPRIRVIGGRK